MPLPPVIDVEKEFGSFVRSFGGEVVEDLIGPSPDFVNADYIFRSVGVVAELKRLVSNKAEDEKLKAKIQTKFNKWMDDGTVPPVYGRVLVESKTLPLHCQKELIELYKPALQHRIVKGNKQIKRTMTEFGVEDGRGLLIIINDGNYGLEADAAMYLVNRVLGTSFRKVHSIVYCTVNMFASAPRTEKPSLVWVHASRSSVPDPDHAEWVMSLFRGWRAHLQGLTGVPIEEIFMSGPEDLAHMRYRKRI